METGQPRRARIDAECRYGTALPSCECMQFQPACGRAATAAGSGFALKRHRVAARP